MYSRTGKMCNTEEEFILCPELHQYIIQSVYVMMVKCSQACIMVMQPSILVDPFHICSLSQKSSENMYRQVTFHLAIWLRGEVLKRLRPSDVRHFHVERENQSRDFTGDVFVSVTGY